MKIIFNIMWNIILYNINGARYSNTANVAWWDGDWMGLCLYNL